MSQNRLVRVLTTLSKRQTDATILLDSVHKPHNLSALIRTCDAVGIPTIHAIPTEGAVRTLNHTSSGSHHWVTLMKHPSISDAIGSLKNSGTTIYAAHMSDEAVDFRQVDYTTPCAIILGAEKFGVSPEAAELADQHIKIPLLGMVESLNVSVAGALILYELERQRMEKGLYNKAHYDQKTLEALTFEWLQPKLARYYQARGLPYPALDEDGDVIR